MNTTELARIDRTIEIKAPPERVWRALTNAKELSTWFQVKIEGEIAEGNEVWMESLHKEGIRFRVLFVELTRPTRFAWQWHPGAVDPNVDYSGEPRTTVTFTLEPSGTGTRLTLAETGFNEISLARRAKVFADNNRGWTQVLVWLSNHAETAA
jgi:uncharacterized protein YndB with AHSA1/START domain